MDRFEGKTAVITGGASGIGRALAERCAAERMNVVLGDIQEDALETTVRAFEEHQVNVLGVHTNTMLRESVEALRDKAIERFGNVHVVCNNAGVFGTRHVAQPLWEVPEEDWDWVMGVNFDGVLYGVQAFVPHMLAHGEGGHIVNTASVAGITAGGGNYGVSKHAVLALTESLERDLQAAGGNVSASVLCPGFVDTKIFESERNRPDVLTVGNEQDDGDFFGSAMTAAGKPPAEVAELVFAAIREQTFYVLPHPSWDEIVRERTEAILARGEVAEFDIERLLQKREAGEHI